MIYKYIKWGCLAASLLAVIIAILLLKPVGVLNSDLYSGQLGSLEKIKLTKRGELNYSLTALYAREMHLSVGAGITTTLATYYELYDVKFECFLEGFGHVNLISTTAKLDVLMKHLRLTGPVSIKFDSGYQASAKNIDVNLISGNIKSKGMSINLNGYDVAAGASVWQIN